MISFRFFATNFIVFNQTASKSESYLILQLLSNNPRSSCGRRTGMAVSENIVMIRCPPSKAVARTNSFSSAKAWNETTLFHQVASKTNKCYFLNIFCVNNTILLIAVSIIIFNNHCCAAKFLFCYVFYSTSRKIVRNCWHAVWKHIRAMDHVIKQNAMQTHLTLRMGGMTSLM